MSDWDDDDFGGFESADVGAESAVTQEAGKQDHVTLAETSSNMGSGAGVLDWILSNNAKSDTSNNTDCSAPPSTSSTQNIDDAKIQDLEAADSGIVEASEQPSSERPPINWTKEFAIAKENIESMPKKESNSVEINNDAIHKLQAELDAALIMKEQTEKSLETLKNELEELAVTRKKELEEKDRQLQEEISQLKQQHHLELDELQNLSEKTIQKLMNQHSEIWKTIEKEKTSECESVAMSVVEKCLELMNQQHALLTKQLDESRQAQERDLKESLKNKQEIMNQNVEAGLEDGKVKIETEMKIALSEQMSEDAQKLQELHTETLKEAMGKQQAHFEETLQSVLVKEREKFSEAIKEAANAARVLTEKEMERRRRAEISRMKTHNISLKTLLSTALEHVERQFPDVVDVVTESTEVE